jgi:hypothetical protein
MREVFLAMMTEETMLKLIDLNAELAKLKMLQGRTPQTMRAERQGSSAQLAPYRDGAIFATATAGGSGTATATNSYISSMARRRCI